MVRLRKDLEKIYYNVKHPAALGGVAKLAKAGKVSYNQAKDFLLTQDTYTLHKPLRHNFNRRKVISYGIGELLQCDLLDLTNYSKYNKNHKFLLTAIDVFSKKGYAIPIKNKSANEVLEALKKLFKKARPIIHIQTDEGKEFYNSKVQNFFKENKIHHYSSKSELKASVVERFNRTLRGRLFRLFTYKKAYKYIHFLPALLKSYNDSVHRSTGFAPNQVTRELEPIIFEKLYGYTTEPLYKFKEEDYVRISKAKKIFRQGYLPSWTEEIFVVHKRFATTPPTYLVRDLKHEILKGRFYEEELQKVIKADHDFWNVETVLKTKGVGKQKEYYVKWKGFDDRFNSWVKASWML